MPKKHPRRYRNTPAGLATLIFLVSVALSPLLCAWFARYPETIPLVLFSAVAAMLGFIPFFITLTQIKTQEAERRRRAIDHCYSLTPAQFETYVAGLFQARGYRVQWVGGPGDGGIDIWLEKDGQKAVVQCKQYTTKKVDVTAIRQFADVLTQANAAKGYFVTTSLFTGPARTTAAQAPITMIDRETLAGWIKAAQAGPYSQPIRYPLFFSTGQWLALILLGTTALGLFGFFFGVFIFG